MYAVLVPPYYGADVRILVKLGKEQLAGVAQNSQPAYNVLFQERTQNINNEIEYTQEDGAGPLRLRASQGEPASRGGEATVFRPARAGLPLPALDGHDGLRALPLLYELGIMKRLTEDEKLVRDLTASLRYELVEDTDTLKLAFRWDDPDFAAAALQEIVSAYLAAHIEAHRNEAAKSFYEDELKRSEVKLGAVEGELAGFLRKGSVANLAVQKESF